MSYNLNNTLLQNVRGKLGKMSIKDRLQIFNIINGLSCDFNSLSDDKKDLCKKILLILRSIPSEDFFKEIPELGYNTQGIEYDSSQRADIHSKLKSMSDDELFQILLRISGINLDCSNNVRDESKQKLFDDLCKNLLFIRLAMSEEDFFAEFDEFNVILKTRHAEYDNYVLLQLKKCEDKFSAIVGENSEDFINMVDIISRAHCNFKCLKDDTRKLCIDLLFFRKSAYKLFMKVFPEFSFPNDNQQEFGVNLKTPITSKDKVRQRLPETNN